MPRPPSLMGSEMRVMFCVVGALRMLRLEFSSQILLEYRPVAPRGAQGRPIAKTPVDIVESA
jgi:hypothetical protein